MQLVYVQAIPISISDKARNFSDLDPSALRMSHSSKVAIHKALGGSKEVVAMGHSSILQEALARGAKDAKALPLCDDPLEQAQSMKDFFVESKKTNIIVGENLDGPFSGAALCGALSSLYDLSLSLDLGEDFTKGGSIFLVRDSGTEAFNIDIRAINFATSQTFPASPIVGRSTLERKSRNFTSADFPGEQSPEEIASMISRKLRRWSV